MPNGHNFEHLPLVLCSTGPALIRGGGKQSPQTKANQLASAAHSAILATASSQLSADWKARVAQRQEQHLPVLAGGMPLLLQVDPSLDLDVLREKFSFEIVAEQEDGYVIVASEDIDLTAFQTMVKGFAVQIHGSATIAKVHRLFDDPDQDGRLWRILSEPLYAIWPTIGDDTQYIVDIGIACTGTREIPKPPKRGKRDTDAKWAAKESEWSTARHAAYIEWDEIKISRETAVEQFVVAYQGEILRTLDGALDGAAVLPDSFTVRLKMVGRGLKDFVLNYPYIFEVVEPDDISLPQHSGQTADQGLPALLPLPPEPNSPAVCIIDSGIQEGHFLLEPAIDAPSSHCFLPGKPSSEVGDFVPPGGHGTRVAGAVLYGEKVAVGKSPLPFWIQNARVLDANNQMPVELFPPEALRAAVRRNHEGPRGTRIFNHSINATSGCRLRHMSAWAAEIDSLSEAYDVLIVQSAGNLCINGVPTQPGVRDHLAAGRDYPKYFAEPSCRIANPAQSLQAITVGSIGYGAAANGDWNSFGSEPGHPSAFSRSGPGIWNVIKPEVVEYGGDYVRDQNVPPGVQSGSLVPTACPELVRSTMFPAGPAVDRDDVGTSYAAPKVARIAAELERLLPHEPTLLYRALIVQSAQWPKWAESILAALRTGTKDKEMSQRAARVLNSIGYGVPDAARATSNTEHRTTFVSNGEASIHASECHIYQVAIPPALRQQADDFDIRIDVTLSYVAQPRRTRRNLRRYLSTWVDWKSSKLGEELEVFRSRALKGEDSGENPLTGSVFPWTLHEKADWGLIREVRRNSGTVQKDWAVVKSNGLPDHFCIAVVGHQGWSLDPDSAARYALAVTLEVVGQEISIYEPLRTAALELQAEVAGAVVDLEAEVEV